MFYSEKPLRELLDVYEANRNLFLGAMKFIRGIVALCFLCLGGAVNASDQIIYIPLPEGCENILKDQYVIGMMQSEPEMHRFDIELERFVYKLSSFVKVTVSEKMLPFLKAEVSSRLSTCTYTASKQRVFREDGLVPKSLIKELRFSDEHGLGKTLVVIEKEKDVKILVVKP